MRSFARLLLIWSLALVVPLKGLAAVTMIGCGPDHHAALSPSSAQASDEHAASHEVAGGERANTAILDMADDAASEDGDTPVGGAGLSQPLKMKCGNCAPCCGAAAPASEILPPTRGDLAADAVAFVAVHSSGIVLGVPHGPPRLIFA